MPKPVADHQLGQPGVPPDETHFGNSPPGSADDYHITLLPTTCPASQNTYYLDEIDSKITTDKLFKTAQSTIFTLTEPTLFMNQLFSILVLSFLCVAGFAQPLVLSDPDKTYHFFQHCAELEVQPGRLPIDSLLLHPEHYRFAPLNPTARPHDPKRAYWFRLQLTNPTSENYFLRLSYLTGSRVWGYEVAGRQVVSRWKATYYGASGGDAFRRSKAIWSLRLMPDQVHTLYLYVEDMAPPALPAGLLSTSRLIKEVHHQDLLYGFLYGFSVLIGLYSLLLGIRLRDRDNLLYALWLLLSGLNYAITQSNLMIEWASGLDVVWKNYLGIFLGFFCSVHLLFGLSFLQLRLRVPWLYRVGVGLLVFFGFCLVSLLLFLLLTPDKQVAGIINLVVATALFSALDGIFSIVAGIVAYWRGFKPALFFLVGTLILWASIVVWNSYFYSSLPMSFWVLNSVLVGHAAEIIFFMVGLTYKINLLKKNQDKAIQEQLRLTQENQTLIENQNRVLEQKVEQRTAELRASQAQLIQKEKLASLGELTAGIAHEIQNPLNFVNNFAEVSTELVNELKEEAKTGRTDDVLAIADDLVQNLEKITNHGSRASAIVRGMLEHSRASTGEKQPTNLNALADEYLRLAYQGQRAKDKNGSTGQFNVELKTDFASNLPNLEVVPQEIGRVLLNLYNNAFYAVREKQKTAPTDYQPTVWVSTRREPGRVVVFVKDNGTGIPEAIREKIFQPFFTTKPTGEGTGLGLSLSYDIVTKGHGGTIAVESREVEGAQFVITLPY